MIKNTNEIRIPMFDISVIEHGEKMIKIFKDFRHYYLVLEVYKINLNPVHYRPFETYIITITQGLLKSEHPNSEQQ